MPLDTEQLYDPILPYVRRDIVRLTPQQTVAEALDTVRSRSTDSDILYLYVVDQDERLVGVVPTRRLLTNAPDAAIGGIMIEDVIAIPSRATVLVACEFFVHRRFLAFPVVDDDGKLVGVVDVTLFTDDLLNTAKRSFEDIFQIIGVHATQARSIWSGFKDRFPWLLTNVTGGTLCALLAGRYEHLLDVIVVLALFIPVVLALSESVSIQSVTLTLQNLHSGPFDRRFFLSSLRRELGTGLLLGAGCGILVGLVSWIWKGQPTIGVVIGGAICLAMTVSCAIGLLLPSVVRAFKVDPQIAAGPIVLALADVSTLLIYFNLAGFLLLR